MILAVLLYLLVGIGVAEFFKRSEEISCLEYFVIVTMYPVVFFSAFVLIVSDYWRNRRK